MTKNDTASSGLAVAAVLTIAIIIGIVGAMRIMHNHAIREQKKELRAIADYWDSRIGPDGYYMVEKPTPELDRWGTPIGVGWERGGAIETVAVVSWGPDRAENTDDDIVIVRRNLVPHGVGEFAAPRARSFFRGMWDGRKDTEGDGDD